MCGIGRIVTQKAAYCLWLVFLGFLSPPAHSATANTERLLKQDIDRLDEERRERRREELHTPSAALPSLQQSEYASSPSKEDESTHCFPIQRIALVPANVLPAKHIAKTLATYEGRCLSSLDIAILQEQLNAEVMRTGLITTRIVIPEQNLTNGMLTLQLLPGIVGSVWGLNLSYMERMFASPVRRGDFLKLQALEQSVDNLNRLASFNASIELQPGNEAGHSHVSFSVERSAPWQAGLSWQGTALQGENASHAIRTNLTLDSPLQLADRLILGMNANVENEQVKGANGGSLDYDIPFGWWQISFGVDRFDYDNEITTGITSFSATGKSRSWRSEISRLMLRDTHQRLKLALHTRQRLSDNYMNGTKIGVSSYRVLSSGLRLEHSLVAAPWVLDNTLDIEYGNTVSTSPVSPFDHHHWRALLNSLLQYQSGAYAFSVGVNGQTSPAKLAPSEQFSLTGQVSGYEPLSLSAASGMAIRTEAMRHWPLNKSGFSSLRSGIGASWAISSETNNGQSAKLSALTAQLIVPWQNLTARISLARPLSKDSLAPLQSGQLDASINAVW